MKLLTFIVDRANYGRLKKCLVDLEKSPEIDSFIVLTGSAALSKYGNLEEEIKKNNLKTEPPIYAEISSGELNGMVTTIGLMVIKFADLIHRIKPDFIQLIGDRYEALAAAIAGSYSGIPIIHHQGGELSGAMDEMTRHAITKMSHIHLVATQKAKLIVRQLGECDENIYVTGCPSIDIVNSVKENQVGLDWLNKVGVGDDISIDQPFFLFIYHADTEDIHKSTEYFNQLLKVVFDQKIQGVIFWPNIDPGSDNIAKKIRECRETHKINNRIRFVRNVAPERYIQLMFNAEFAIGNSSSLVREGSYIGLPTFLVGDRQLNREIGKNIIPIPYDEIYKINQLIEARAYISYRKESDLYGCGDAVDKINFIISSLANKKIRHYKDFNLL